MGIIIWLIVGGVVGWLASLIMRTDAQQGILINIVVGIIGLVLAGLVLGKGNINQGLTVETFLWSLLGAVILLAVVNLIRRVAHGRIVSAFAVAITAAYVVEARQPKFKPPVEGTAGFLPPAAA